jgi:hypothetical protein
MFLPLGKIIACFKNMVTMICGAPAGAEALIFKGSLPTKSVTGPQDKMRETI